MSQCDKSHLKPLLQHQRNVTALNSGNNYHIAINLLWYKVYSLASFFSQWEKLLLAVSINHQVTKRPLRKCVIQLGTIWVGAESNATLLSSFSSSSKLSSSYAGYPNYCFLSKRSKLKKLKDVLWIALSLMFSDWCYVCVNVMLCCISRIEKSATVTLREANASKNIFYA